LLKHADASDSSKKFEYAQTIVHSNQEPNSHGACVKSDIEIPVKQYHLIDEDIELYPGIEFISLSGHIPGSSGLTFHLEKDPSLCAEQHGPWFQLNRQTNDFSYLSDFQQVQYEFVFIPNTG